MSSLYFRHAVICRLEDSVPEFDMQPLPPAAAERHCVNSGTVASNGRIHQAQNTTTTSLCWSNNILYLQIILCSYCCLHVCTVRKFFSQLFGSRNERRRMGKSFSPFSPFNLFANGERNIAWASVSVFRLKRQHIHTDIFM
jgi:hypothetical protein